MDGAPPRGIPVALLREAFAAMDIVTLREYEADVSEGSGHLDRSALIGLVARRR